MAVLLPNGTYRLGRQPHPLPRDAHGTPLPAIPSWTPPAPGAAARAADGSWTFRLDMTLWPLAAGDVVERTSDGKRWTITGTPRRHQVPGVPHVDYVAAAGVQVPPDVDVGYPS